MAELIRTGYLKEHAADRTGTRRVDERSLAAFEEAFVAAKDLAEALGRRPFGVTRRLRRHGVRPILKEGRPEDFTVHVRGSEVEERLGLRTEPAGRSRPEPFWEDARTAVLATGPAIQVGPRPPHLEAVVWNSKRTARVVVVVRRRCCPSRWNAPWARVASNGQPSEGSSSNGAGGCLMPVQPPERQSGMSANEPH